MGDKKIAQVMKLLLQLLKEVDDLRLNPHIEGRDRLVADDQRGLARKGPGDPMRCLWPPLNWWGYRSFIPGWPRLKSFSTLSKYSEPVRSNGS